MQTRKKALGLRIKEFRERKNLTQEKLAEMVGIDPKHLSRIENGRNYPSVDTLEKLVDNLNVTFEDIFEFGHLTDRHDLIEKINFYLANLSIDKLSFIYKMIKEI